MRTETHLPYRGEITCRRCGSAYKISGMAEPFVTWCCYAEDDAGRRCKTMNSVRADFWAGGYREEGDVRIT